MSSVALRNFWVELDTDGNRTRTATGPRSKDGGLHVRLSMRDQGASKLVLEVLCYEDRGRLYVDVLDVDGKRIFSRNTAR